jgi:uncharacterized protein
MQYRGRTATSVAQFGFTIALISMVLVACGQGHSLGPPKSAVRVEVTRVTFDQGLDGPYVQLDDRASQQSIQIAIGADEARAISFELHGVKTTRPLTIELLGKAIARTGNAVERVEITEARNQIYYARIILDQGRYALDCRPSDAIALALEVRAPIYVSTALMSSNGVLPRQVATPVTATNCGITVQELTPDLAQYFAVEAGSGVVVADFDRTAADAGVKRGDLLTAAGGRRVHTPTEFGGLENADGEPVALTLLRGASTLTITIARPAKSSVAE